MIPRLCRVAAVLAVLASAALAQNDRTWVWRGAVRDVNKHGISGLHIELESGDERHSTVTAGDGSFQFTGLTRDNYRLVLRSDLQSRDKQVDYKPGLHFPVAASFQVVITDQQTATFESVATTTTTNLETGGGEHLSSRAVSELPLNKRDFSQLLLLAAGTMTDANGATNFTQQFAINGQRGVEAVFAMDGADTSDPEMGGATFSNFNVDAVQEIQSSSGVMPAEIGRGAAGFTNIVTRSGQAGFHGSIFEFVRNSAFDARNFFDRQSVVNPGRIPPFRRNEFGLTNGGPVVIPGLYNGREKTFYFAEYQGFRQILGTTQVIPVPTSEERRGLDTTAFAGDTLLVPVSPKISGLINRYPLPNDRGGSYGVHTYATSSKVQTNADQASLRLDRIMSDKAQLFARFSLDNLRGPTTNPSQTAIDPSFGITYVDHQRNAALRYIRTVSPNLILESALSFTRTTPNFKTPNRTDPALAFEDGLYEPFNSAGGSVTTAVGNLFVARQNMTWTKGKHTWKIGVEARANRDTSYFGTTPNGEYVFGGGTSYAPVAIRSATGTHDIPAGAPLPDTLSALLTANPFSYSVAVAPAYFPQGTQIGVAAISRYAVHFFAQDTWKINDRLSLEYGLRYELYTPITERAKRTSGVRFVDTPAGLTQEYVINPQPGYRTDPNGWGPRARLSWHFTKDLQFSVGGGITTIPPNIWQDNFLTGGTPITITPRQTAAPGAPISFSVPITSAQLPRIYTPGGLDIYASGNTKAVPANTVIDLDRFERDLAALNPSHQITPLNAQSISQDVGNSYLGTWTAGLERQVRGLDLNAAYVGTAGVKLPAVDFPNGYPGADPRFAPYTLFNSSGTVVGGFGTEVLLTDRSHSSYHSLQLSAQGNLGRYGPGLQASYTWSKSLDDTSTVIGGFVAGGAGAAAQAWPQNPNDTRAEKGPSTFDVTHAFTASIGQEFHLDKLAGLRWVNNKITNGWQMLSISTLSTGQPFTIYSGVQQTGVGANSVDRPDQVGNPTLSVTRKVREDYFGQGAANVNYFFIPIGLVGGTGPNSGRFGTLGRNTFRGPAFHNFDFAFIKDTPFGQRGNGELIDLQFRAELFNLFNIVNFGLPANIVRGSGFGLISRTAGTSRQIQFSLKLIF